MGLTAVFTLLVGIARADIYTWVGTSSDWTVEGNWQGGIQPVAGGTVYYEPGSATPLITGTMAFVSVYEGNDDYTIQRQNTVTTGASMGTVYNYGTGALIIDVIGRVNGIAPRSGLVILNSGTFRSTANITVEPNSFSTSDIKMVVNGFISVDGNVTVGISSANSYTPYLMGTGTINATSASNGRVYVTGADSGISASKRSGVIAPGDPTQNNGIGTLTINSKLVFRNYDSATINDYCPKLELQIGDLSNYDRLIVTGTVGITGDYGVSFGRGARLQLLIGEMDVSTVQLGSYDLITYGNALVGLERLTLTADTQAWLDEWSALDEDYSWQLSNVPNNLDDLTQGGFLRFELIPEPSVLLLTLCGGAALAVCVWRRRKH
jgi:hypothetical protein